MPPPPFLCDARYRRPVAGILRRLPRLEGEPIAIRDSPGLRDRHGQVHAGSFLRKRVIAFNCASKEFPRIFVHELFHFAWLRAGNERRSDFEELLRSEWREGASGELGWSAEWRKHKLTPGDVRARTRRWREYCCESFCDTAAWLYSGVKQHPEYTLATRRRAARRTWFKETFGGRAVVV